MRNFKTLLLGGTLYLLAATTGFAASQGEDQTMEGLYYGIWAAVLGAGILASRKNLGESVRQLALWAFIILGFVAVYIYKNDLQQFGSRITAGLIPGRTSVMTDSDGFLTTVLYKGNDGHFHAEAQVGDKTISMMVDTGASTTALTFEDAMRLGLSPQTLSFDTTVMTANGEAKSATATLPALRIGDIERTNVRVGIAEQGKMDVSLLGMNFLGSLSSFSFEGNELKLKN